MIAEAEKIGPDEGLVQVQANRYEGFTVWATAMIESAGGADPRGPDEVDLEQAPTERALEVMGEFVAPRRPPTRHHTSTEDTARLAFESGGSAFMINYPFVYPSAKENAPDVFKQIEAAQLPAGRRRTSRAARRSAGSTSASRAFSENQDLAFEAIKCLVQPENQITDRDPGRAAAGARGRLRHQGDREGLPGLLRPDQRVDRQRRAAPGDARLPGRLAGDPARRSTR